MPRNGNNCLVHYPGKPVLGNNGTEFIPLVYVYISLALCLIVFNEIIA